jgi:hypothetical protein
MTGIDSMQIFPRLLLQLQMLCYDINGVIKTN